MGLTLGLAVLPFDVPVVPDAPDARDLLMNELSKAEYAAAQPTLFDIISQAFLDWLQRLFTPGSAVPADWLVVALIVAVIVGIVVAILVWGVPRINRRSVVVDSLFGEDDRRTAAQLRTSAATAADRGDFSTAVAERFRAIARALAERTIVLVSAGTTAHDFAARASAAFPGHSSRLASSADDFDSVRYLDRPGSAEQYSRLVSLDDELTRSAPRVLEDLVSATVS